MRDNKIILDTHKMLGFRLADVNQSPGVTLGAKVGNGKSAKVGNNKLDIKDSKIGAKVGRTKDDIKVNNIGAKVSEKITKN